MELNYASNKYPLDILLTDPATLKQQILEKRDDDVIIMFFQVFLVFGVAGSVKSIQCGCSLDVEFNYASKGLFYSKFE